MGLALLNPRVWAGLALAAALAGIGWWGYNLVYDRGAQSVQTKWDAEKKDQAEQSAKVATDALAVTKSLQVSADNQRKAANAQISKLNDSLSAALERLRERPARPDPSDVPTGAGAAAGVGCTGAQLYRPDAELLTRESARAQRLLIDLKFCQAQYRDVYEALNVTKE